MHDKSDNLALELFEDSYSDVGRQHYGSKLDRLGSGSGFLAMRVAIALASFVYRQVRPIEKYNIVVEGDSASAALPKKYVKLTPLETPLLTFWANAVFAQKV